MPNFRITLWAVGIYIAASKGQPSRCLLRAVWQPNHRNVTLLFEKKPPGRRSISDTDFSNFPDEKTTKKNRDFETSVTLRPRNYID